MARINKKSIPKPIFPKEKYQNNDDDFFIGNKFEGEVKHLESKKRITKRRENVIILLDKFDQESKIIELQIKNINIELRSTEKELKKNIDNLTTIQAELNQRKEQLQTIAKISDNYVDIVCEKFNVKKEHIKIIKS
jgi:hypothetical protein